MSLAVIALLSYDIIYPRVQKAIGGEEWKRYILCPIIDFCNHSSRAESDISYEYFFSSFVLKTGPYKKGEQVGESYVLVDLSFVLFDSVRRLFNRFSSATETEATISCFSTMGSLRRTILMMSMWWEKHFRAY